MKEDKLIIISVLKSFIIRLLSATPSAKTTIIIATGIDVAASKKLDPIRGVWEP